MAFSPRERLKADQCGTLRFAAYQGMRWIKRYPITGLGRFPTVDEVAKIALLFSNDGKHKEQPLLHGGKIREAFNRTEWKGYVIPYLDNGRYRHSIWSHDLFLKRDCRAKAFYMAGFGGNYATFLPNGNILIRFMDESVGNWQFEEFNALVRAAEAVRTSCN